MRLSLPTLLNWAERAEPNSTREPERGRLVSTRAVPNRAANTKEGSESGEHGEGSEGEEGGEESGTQYGLDDTYDQVRAGEYG